MSSPLSFFRKYQFMMMVGFGILLMFAFVVAPPLLDVMQSRSIDPIGQETVVTWQYGQVSEGELDQFALHHQLTIRFLRELVQETQNRKGVPKAPLLQQAGDEQDLFYRIMLSKKAESMGMLVSDDAIFAYLDLVSDGTISRGDMGVLLTTATSSRMSQDAFFNHIRTELMAQQMMTLARSGFYRAPPARLWDFYNQLNRRVTAELLPVTVASFTKEVKDPSDDELKKLYDEFKDDYPFPDSPDPGFKRRTRIAFEYVKADFDQFFEAEVAAVRDTITAEEIEKHYNENPSEFQVREEPPADPANPGDTPPADPANSGDTPPADPANPGDTPPADPPKSGDTPPADPDTSGDTPPVTPPADPARPGDTPPADPARPGDGQDATTQGESKPGDGTSNDPPAEKTGGGDPCGQEPPKTEAGQEPPKTETGQEPPKTEAGQEPPKTEAGQEPPKTEAGQEPPKTETGQEPPKTEAGQEPPKTEAGQGATGDEPARPATGADAEGQKPDEKPMKIRPLDETLREEIRDKLARERARTPAQEKMMAAVNSVRPILDRFATRYSLHKADRDKFSPPDPIDYAAIAAEKQLATGKTRALDILEVDGITRKEPSDEDPAWYELLRAVQHRDHDFQRMPFPILAYGGDVDLYRPQFIYDPWSPQMFFPSKVFLYWRTDVQPERVPTFEEARAAVLRAWKMRAAVALAEKAAGRLADDARAAPETSMAESLGAERSQGLIVSDPFSWMTRGAVALGGGQPMLSSITGKAGDEEITVENAGNEFMKSLFAMKAGGVAVIPDAAKRTVYVVRLSSELLSDEQRRELFLVTGPNSDVEYLAQMDLIRQMRQWYDQLEAEMKVQWIRDPQSFTSG